MAIASQTSVANPRVAFVGRSREALETYGGSLVQYTLGQSSAVLCVAPGFPLGQAREGVLAGAILSDLAADPDDARSFASSAARRSLASTLSDWQPDIVVACGTAALDALGRRRRRSGPFTACILTPEDDQAVKTGSWLRPWPLPRRLGGCDAVFVNNHELARALEDGQRGARGTRIIVTPGRGPVVAALENCPLPALDNGLSFVLFDDGRDEAFLAAFRSAAEAISSRSDQAKFVIAREALYATASDEPGDGGGATVRTYEPGSEHTVIRDAHVIVQGRAATPYPFAFLTALAAGRPVIARDTPALRDAVDEVVNGILISGDEPRALTKAVGALLRRPDLLASMARASRAKAQRRFDAAVINRDILAALQAE